jgi:hypothetical protein
MGDVPGVTPPSEPAKPGIQLDWKHAAIAVLSILSALGYGGVLPTASAPAASPCAPDASFQADVRTALAKQADALSDLRERMARVEATVAGTR